MLDKLHPNKAYRHIVRDLEFEMHNTIIPKFH